MSVIIQLSDLVISRDYLEGCSLHNKKSTMILSVTEEKEFTSVTASVSGNEVKLKIDNYGKILDKSCSAHCSGFCSHVVAAALLFNEISMDEADPSEQLLKFVSKTVDCKSAFPCKITVENDEVHLDSEAARTDLQLNRIAKIFGDKNLALLVGLFPEKFILGNVRLFAADSPLVLFYKITPVDVSFFFSDTIRYFKQEGVAIDSESGSVHRFSFSCNETIETLLRISIGYNKRDDLIKAVSELGDNLAGEIILSGELNLEKIILDENTETTFKVSARDGKVYLKIFLEKEGDFIEFSPKRRNFDQNYSLNGRIYSLVPRLIKNIKTALSGEGFKFYKNSYTAPISLFAKIAASESGLSQIGKVEIEQNFKKINIPKAAADNSEIVLDVNSEEKWFSFNIKLPQTSDFITSNELFNALNQYERGVLEPVISDLQGKPVILEKSGEFLAKMSEMVGATLFRDREKIPVAHLVKLLKTKNKKALNSFVGSVASKEKYLQIFDSLSHGILPQLEDVDFSNVPLRKYQIEGFRWFSLLKILGLGGILADEMGLGKTLQSLAMIKAEKGDLPSMVVCPKTLVWSWDREIEKFFPEMKRVVIDSLKPEERATRWKNATQELILTSYAVVINDFSHLRDKIFETIVVDEAQHIKNNNTKRFKILTSLKSKHRFALTGTPLENHISDLWAIFQFIMPGYLGSRKEADKIEKSNNNAELNRLRAMTSPFILRRLKREILDELPELTIKEYPVEMTPKQKEIYLSTLLRGRAEFLEKGDSLNKIEVLSILSKLRLAANHPSLVSQTDSDPELSGKIATILELVNAIFAGGSKVLIFSQYVKMLKIIEKAFNDCGIDYFYMDGETKERMSLVEQFNGGAKQAFLLSLKVGGVGLNLTAADHVIIVDPWWNPAVEEQAWSRAHRIGQTKKVIVNKLFSKGTIEEKILNLHQKKRNMVDFFMSKSLKEPSEDFVKMIADLELSVKE